MNKFLKIGLIALGLLIIPLVLQLTIGTGIDGQGWNWKPGDFVFAWVVWFGAGAAYEIFARRTTNPNRRLVIGIVVFLVLALIWVGAATGFEGVPDRVQEIKSWF